MYKNLMILLGISIFMLILGWFGNSLTFSKGAQTSYSQREINALEDKKRHNLQRFVMGWMDREKTSVKVAAPEKNGAHLLKEEIKHVPLEKKRQPQSSQIALKYTIYAAMTAKEEKKKEAIALSKEISLGDKI